jgi:hypothetical protein
MRLAWSLCLVLLCTAGLAVSMWYLLHFLGDLEESGRRSTARALAKTMVFQLYFSSQVA